MRLDTEPSGIVVITPNSGSSTGFTFSPLTLTFTASNWAAQEVTVTADVDRDHLDGGGTITHSITTSPGADYPRGRSIPSVEEVTVTDNDDPITFSRTAITAVEGGADGSYTVSLNTEPRTGTVIVRVQKTGASSPVTVPDYIGDFSVSSNALWFARENWNTPQIVTVHAEEDADNAAETYYVSDIL